MGASGGGPLGDTNWGKWRFEALGALSGVHRASGVAKVYVDAVLFTIDSWNGDFDGFKVVVEVYHVKVVVVEMQAHGYSP